MAEKTLISNISAFLKELYPEDALETQFNDEKEFYHQIEKTSDVLMYGGRQAIIPVRKWRGNGLGARNEDGDLPDAGAPGYDKWTVTLSYHYDREYVSNQTLEMAKGGDMSFLDAMSDLSADMMEALLKDYNWKMFNTSAALRCTTTGTVAGTTFVASTLKGLHENMSIDIYNAAGTTLNGATVKITDIAESTNTITIDTSVTSDASSNVYQAGEKNISLHGLLDGTATSGTYQGIARSTNSWAIGKAISTSSSAITHKLMVQMYTAALNKGAKPKFWLCDRELADMIYLNLLAPDQRHTDTDIAGGFKTFTYRDLPVVTDIDSPAGDIWCVDPKKIKIIQTVSGFHWAENDGSRLFRIPGKDSWEILLRNYSDMLVTQPNAVPYCTSITES